MDTLLEQYQAQLKRTRALKRSIPEDTAEDKDRHKILTGMITDLEIAVEWLETGIPYYNKNGIYQKSSLEFIDIVPESASIYPTVDPLEKVEEEIDGDLEQGEKNGFNARETFQFLKWAKSRVKEKQRA